VGILNGGSGWFKGQGKRRDAEWRNDLYYNTDMGGGGRKEPLTGTT